MSEKQERKRVRKSEVRKGGWEIGQRSKDAGHPKPTIINVLLLSLSQRDSRLSRCLSVCFVEGDGQRSQRRARAREDAPSSPDSIGGIYP